MKRLRTMYLEGVLREDEESLIIENDLKGIGWKIEEFRIISNDFAEAQDNTYVARLSMQSGLNNQFAQFERNDVLGFATYGGGGNEQILDMNTIIVDELYITNCTQSTAITNKSICYQVILGLYQIDDKEQLVAQVKISQG